MGSSLDSRTEEGKQGLDVNKGVKAVDPAATGVRLADMPTCPASIWRAL